MGVDEKYLRETITEQENIPNVKFKSNRPFSSYNISNRTFRPKGRENVKASFNFSNKVTRP